MIPVVTSEVFLLFLFGLALSDLAHWIRDGLFVGLLDITHKIHYNRFRCWLKTLLTLIRT